MTNSDFYSDGDSKDKPADQKNGAQKTLLTIKGSSAKVEGKLKISNSVEVGCEVVGELDVGGELVIQRSGNVTANIKTNNVVIKGAYKGNMEAAGNVQIMETGKTSGNIKTDSLIIEKGGIFSGNVERITEN